MEIIQYEEQREKKVGRKLANVWIKLSCLTRVIRVPKEKETENEAKKL